MLDFAWLIPVFLVLCLSLGAGGVLAYTQVTAQWARATATYTSQETLNAVAVISTIQSATQLAAANQAAAAFKREFGENSWIAVTPLAVTPPASL